MHPRESLKNINCLGWLQDQNIPSSTQPPTTQHTWTAHYPPRVRRIKLCYDSRTAAERAAGQCIVNRLLECKTMTQSESESVLY